MGICSGRWVPSFREPRVPEQVGGDTDAGPCCPHFCLVQPGILLTALSSLSPSPLIGQGRLLEDGKTQESGSLEGN